MGQTLQTHRQGDNYITLISLVGNWQVNAKCIQYFYFLFVHKSYEDLRAIIIYTCLDQSADIFWRQVHKTHRASYTGHLRLTLTPPRLPALDHPWNKNHQIHIPLQLIETDFIIQKVRNYLKKFGCGNWLT